MINLPVFPVRMNKLQIRIKIKVHSVRQLANALEVLIHGNSADAQYVSDRMNSEKGVKVREPTEKPGMPGFIYIVVEGHREKPLSRQRAIAVLKADPNIEVRLRSEDTD